ncbi:MAG: hypothetical protein HLUCCO03_11670 [Marinobacter sp. HL-58]|nr:MAG: hypothetical protein HLUCCO03_11670 [Marinobacter sp. HL-58]
MNLMAGFLGYSMFTITCVTIAVIGYWHADRLEEWAKTRVAKKRNRDLGGTGK